MNAIKNFDEFIKQGTVKKQTPDKNRASFLSAESETNYAFLLEMVSKIPVAEKNANTYIKTCYDIIMERVRAKMISEGYNAIGNGAHEAEISYLRNMGFKENDIQFADQMRYYRNSITYYGKRLDTEYAIKVIEYTKKIYHQLKEKGNGT